ncbi:MULTISPECIES: hypothetical protein [unclassified Gilliamella]|uniref:hypothetical protein n=1 Tax=unclassified Gilliamella TaxID=2685620 RepID=UPI0013251E60|nr:MULTISPECIES: hypothetical protein [unclassified Gilliamella]MWN30989.1 hypothetical protein [Gilliamella sp. Pra-s60]MWP28446.1 hypothetical protein [Gilliamella sp. Pra-s54]
MRYAMYFLKRFFVSHLNKFNKDWDRKLNEILDDFEIVESNRYYVTLQHNGDSYQVWIANYPYGSYTLKAKNGAYLSDKEQFRPSIRTQYRFDNLVLNPVLKEMEKQKQQRIKKFYE